jgi:hypothetical protein
MKRDPSLDSSFREILNIPKKTKKWRKIKFTCDLNLEAFMKFFVNNNV